MNDLKITLTNKIIYDKTRIWAFNTDQSLFIVLHNNNVVEIKRTQPYRKEILLTLDDPDFFEQVDKFLVDTYKPAQLC